MWRHYFAGANGTTISYSLGRQFRPVFSLPFLHIYGLYISIDNRAHHYKGTVICNATEVILNKNVYTIKENVF
jgi:hypothetical protein